VVDVPARSPLVLEVARLGRLARPLRLVPHAAYVVTTDGQARTVLHRPPAYGQRRDALLCHVVDVSQHVTRATVAVPARGDVYAFGVHLDAVWAVTDPCRLVDAAPADPGRLVAERLRDRLWHVVRAHEATSTLAAEASARVALDLPLRLEEGLEVLRAAVRVTIDPRLGEALLPGPTAGCPDRTGPHGAMTVRDRNGTGRRSSLNGA
jgi:hypothetical protein